MNSTFSQTSVVVGLIYALLHLVGLVAILTFRRVSRNTWLMILGFACGILVELFGRVVAGLSMDRSVMDADIWIMILAGELIVFAVIVVGLACVLVDIRERLDLRQSDFAAEGGGGQEERDEEDRWWERRPGDRRVQRPGEEEL
jgi:hypothetical protein